MLAQGDYSHLRQKQTLVFVDIMFSTLAMDVVNIGLLICASVFILFLPGLTLSFLFFSQGKIDFPERLAISFALSISIVPLIVFYANLIGVPVRRETVFIEVLLIIMAGLMGLVIKKEYCKIKHEGEIRNSKHEIRNK